MNEIEPDLFMELAPSIVRSEAEDLVAARVDVESKWEQLLAQARSNPVAAKVNVVVGVPQRAGAVPDVFMKGETTSPHRQYVLTLSLFRLAPFDISSPPVRAGPVPLSPCSV